MRLPDFMEVVNNKLTNWFVMLAYSYLSLIILIEVIRRYVFSASSPWGEMTARYAFVYLAYVAAAEAIRMRRHIHIDLLLKRLSARMRMFFDLYIDLLTTGLAVLVIYHSLEVINIQVTVNIVMESADVNLAFAYAALPVGWCLLIIRIAQNWIAAHKPKTPGSAAETSYYGD